MGRLYSSHVRTVKSCRLALAVLLVAIVAPQLDAQESRTVLDGTVVLEDAAEVPHRIVEALNRYQNVRSAGFGTGPRTAAGSTSGRASPT
jgi:hypothetical protein